MSKSQYSAGIMIYKRVNEHVYVLLGRDYRYNCWSDFGGKSEWIDNNDPIRTASREFYEETSGVIIGEALIYAHVKRHGVCVKCKSYNNHDYYMYIIDDMWIQTSDDCEADFRKQQRVLLRTNHISLNKYMEKSDMQWRLLDDVLKSPGSYRGVFKESVTCNYDFIRRECVTV